MSERQPLREGHIPTDSLFGEPMREETVRTNGPDTCMTGLVGFHLQEPIKEPAHFEWHEVTNVAHYYMSVDTMTRAIQVRDETPGYGGQR